MINLIDNYYVICTYKDWVENISILVNEKEYKRIETNVQVKDIYLNSLLSHIMLFIKPGEYCTYDFFRKSIKFRKVLDLKESKKYSEINLKNWITYINFRVKNSQDVFKVLEKNKKNLLDPTFGIITEEYRGLSEATPIIAFAGKKGERLFDAYGRDDTYNKSYYTGILEALERYHGAGSKFVEKFRFSEIQLKKFKIPFVSFEDFCHYTDINYNNNYFEFPKYSEKHYIDWITSYSLMNNEDILIPLQIAYYSSELVDLDSSKRYIAESSNGVAIGSNWIEASIAGILEIIERDSFLVYWYTKSSPRKVIDPENIDDENIQLLLSYLNSIQYKVHIFDTTLESKITSFWILLEYNGDQKNLVKFYTSGSAHFDAYTALYSALVEASTSIKIFNKYKNMNYKDYEVSEMYKNFNNVRFLEDHILLYSSKKMKKHLLFALETSNTIYSADLFKKVDSKKMTQLDLLQEMKRLFSSFDEEIYLTDISSNFLKELGLSCVKAHIPSYQNISFGHMYQNINYNRLKRALIRNNLDGNLNNCHSVPHPFP